MRRELFAFAGVGLGVVVVLLALTGTAAAAPTPVNNCTTIASPGGYELTTDITNSNVTPCIEITADDVVFDGADHTIDGVGNGTAIEASPSVTQTNVTVRNATVTDWHTGIRYGDLTAGTVSEMAVDDNNGVGIVHRGVDDSRIVRTTVTDSDRDGIRLLSSSNNDLVDVESSANTNVGISFGAGSSNNTLQNSTVTANRVGLAAATFSNDTLVTNTLVENSTDYGLSIESADGTHLENTSILDSGDWAVFQVDTGVTTSERLELPTATVDTTSHMAAFDGNVTTTTPPAGKTDAGTAAEPRVEAINTTESGYLYLNMSYDSPGGADESTLRMWAYDGNWAQVSGTNGVNTAADYVYANISLTPTWTNYVPLGNVSTPSPTPTPTPVTPVTPITASPTATATPATPLTAITASPTPTPTATATPVTAITATTTTGGGPGLGPLVALLAILAGGVLLLRRG